MKWLWDGKPWQAFKNFAIIFSFTVNVILVLVLLLVAPLILPIVNQIAVPIVGGLNHSFIDMGEAKITRTIQVDDTIPINFTLPLATTTRVRLTESVPLAVNARFVLPGGGGTINGLVELQLPANLELPVYLELSVPVSQTIPVQLAVDVDIPLSETELGQPFSDLQAIFTPLDNFLLKLPDNEAELFQRIRDGAAGGPADQQAIAD
jgi:hypothetical protein